MQFIYSSLAVQDLLNILEHTEVEHGTRARIRYEALIQQAIQDITLNVELPGRVNTPSIYAGSFIYHLKHSRRNVASQVGRVKEPRHFLLCRITDDHILEIARLVHDKMQLSETLMTLP